MNVFPGWTPRTQNWARSKPTSAHLEVTGPTTRAPVDEGESTTVVAVYALVFHLRILRIFAIIVFFWKKKTF